MKKTKRFLATMLVVLMLAMSMPSEDFVGIDFKNIFSFSVNATNANKNNSIVKFISAISKKNAVPNGYIGIYTASDLYNIKNNSSGKYILMNDIDMLSFGEWKSFGINGLTLDGNGNVISNLTSNTNGLFSESNGSSTITNLGLENVNINSKSYSVGGIVGKSEYSDSGLLTITNCYVTGRIIASGQVGGIVGSFYWNDGCNISNCYNFANISGNSSIGGIVGSIDTLQFATYRIQNTLNRGIITGTSYLGGIVGRADGYGDQLRIYIEKSCNYGSIVGRLTNGGSVGGICGRQEGVFGLVSIADCYNVKDVIGFNGVGGLCGASRKQMIRSYNIGKVTGNDNVGAIVGIPTIVYDNWGGSGNCSVTDCFYISGEKSAHGTGLSNTQLKQSSSFKNFDFSSVWTISSNVNSGYPYISALKNIKWAFDDEKYNEIVSQYYADGQIEIFVYGISGGEKVLVNGATVSVYCGMSVIESVETKNGVASFDFNKLISKGYSLKYLLNYATVSAHFNLGDIELCSETITAEGIWEGTKMTDLLNTPFLVLDEPRQHISLSVAYSGKDQISLFENRYDKICEVMCQYAKDLAQMTNGHVLLSSYSIIHAPDDMSMYSEDSNGNVISNAPYDILIFENEYWPRARINGINSEDGHIKLSYNHLDSKTLAHESGHYIFGFFDEYCYGKMYRYDTDGDGLVCEFDECGHSGNSSDPHTDIENSGYWDRGWVSRPTKDPFGLMENQDESIEMSDRNNYNYLEKPNYVDKTNPDIYTMQYYMNEESCEDSLMSYFESIASSYGYNINYSCTSVNKQTVDYWYADLSAPANLNERKEVNTYSVYELAEETMDQIIPVKFSYLNENLSVEMDRTGVETIFLKDIKSQNVIEIKESKINLSLKNLCNNKYMISVVKKENDTLVKNTYCLYVLDDSNEKVSLITHDKDYEIVVVESNILLTDNRYSSISTNYNFFSDDNNFDGIIEFSVAAETLCNYNSLNFFKFNEDNKWKQILTEKSIGEHGIMHVKAFFDGQGTYSLMSLPREELTIESVTNVKAETQNLLYDSQIKLQFEDSNSNSCFYKIYYDTVENYNITKHFSYTKTFTANANSMVLNTIDGYTDYIVAIQVIGETGSMSELTWIEVSLQPSDSDSDGIPDYWLDIFFQLKETGNIANGDNDEDGLNNLQEYQLGTDPLNKDSDGDNVFDNIELQNSLDPTNPCTDGRTNDYIVLYGTPDIKIVDISFNSTDFLFSLENLTEGKAMRTYVSIEIDGKTKGLWTVNIDSKSVVDFSLPIEEVKGCSSLIIQVDENHITNDIDYSNNSFIYVPASSISFSQNEYSIIKKSTSKIEVLTEPSGSADIYSWSVDENNVFSVNSKSGLVECNGIGTANLSVTTLSGKSAKCRLNGIAFEGAEYNEFDSKLINDNTEVAIVGYIGDDLNVIVPTTIGGLPVTEISANAFLNCTFESVYIPVSVKYIAYTSFNGAYNIKNIFVQQGNENYISSNGILYNIDRTQLIRCPIAYAENVVVSDTVTSIVDYAFYKCNVNNVIINETLTSIGSYSFAYCENINSINLNSVVEINTEAFYGSGLTEITIPETVTYIGMRAFNNCSDLTTVNYNAIDCKISSFIFPISAYSTFSSSVNKITIGEKVKYIPSAAFMYTGISDITIPSNVQSIGTSAFYYCDNLKRVTFADNSELSSISSSAFYADSALTDIVLPSAVTSLGDYSFYNCKALTSVELPDKITSINPYTFYGCSSLVSIEIPNNITSIGTKAFDGCTSLGKTTIEHVVSDIGESAFANCSSLIIRCYNRTAAYDYAVANSIPYDIIESEVESVIIDDFTAVKGNTAEIGYQINPYYTSENYIITSSNTMVATVDGDTLNALKCGKTTLTITTDSGKTDTCIVTVVGVEGAEYTDFDYTLSSDNTTVTILGYTGNDKDIVIPDMIGGLPVTNINSTFDGCTFENITIGKNVTTWSAVNFNSAKFLQNIFVSDENMVLSSIDGVLYSKDGKTLRKYPGGRTAETYEISENVTTIGQNAFSNSKIASMHILEGVESIGFSAFSGCMNLKTIYFDAIDCSIVSIFNIAPFPSTIKELRIGEKVERIPQLVLKNVDSITVTVPGSVKNIEDGAFYDCYNLTIKAFKNSCAKTYAETNGYNFIAITCGNCICNDWQIVTDSTCIAVGEKTGICSVCGASMVSEIPTKDHSYGDWNITKPATCIQTGEKEKSCSVCGDKITETIAKSAHDYISQTVKPTCEADGYTTHTCLVCGTSYTDNITNAFGHTDSDSDGNCDNCGADLNLSGHCDCICHNDNAFVRFIYKIVQLFWKLFKINKTCECGMYHY